MLEPDTAKQEHGAQSYLAPSPDRRASVPFEAGVQALLPWSNSPRHDLPSYPGRTALLRAALGDRVPYNTIKKWREGKRTAPQWARDLLASHLENHARQCAETAAALRANEKGVR